jgi:hypothetical protein
MSSGKENMTHRKYHGDHNLKPVDIHRTTHLDLRRVAVTAEQCDRPERPRVLVDLSPLKQGRLSAHDARRREALHRATGIWT